MQTYKDFTVRKAIENCHTARELETRLGFPVGYLDKGGKIVQFVREPTLEDFEQGGSTRYQGVDLKKKEIDPRTGKEYLPGDRHNMNNDERRNTSYFPGAWYRQDLVKVIPNTRADNVIYPSSKSPAEQWYMKRPQDCFEVGKIENNRVIWFRPSLISQLRLEEMQGGQG